LAEGPREDMHALDLLVNKFCNTPYAVPGLRFCSVPKGEKPPSPNGWRCYRWANDQERDAARAEREARRARIPSLFATT
jgi:hypothetical protein